MPRIYTLNDIGNSGSSKLGSPPSNRYPPSRLELEEQLKKDREMFIRSAKQLITKYHTLDKENKQNEHMQNDLDYLHEENEQIESLKSEINLKDFEITSFEARINELEAELEQTAQKALLKDTDTTLSLHEIKVKELKNKLEQVTQNLSFRDRLIFCLRSRVSDLEDELEQISLKPDSSSNDSKTGGDAVEKVSGFSKTHSFSSHHSEPELNESKVKDV
ncbi:14903_t:CDS:2, partial [Dentiscutata erythropus]